MLLVMLIVKKSLKQFTKKANQTECRVEKVIRRNGEKLHVKWKDYDNSLIVRLIKKMFLYKMVNFFLNHVTFW